VSDLLCPRCAKPHHASQDCAGADLAVDHCPSCGRVRQCPPAPCPKGFHVNFGRRLSTPWTSLPALSCPRCGEAWRESVLTITIFGGGTYYECGDCGATLIEGGEGVASQ
jgi:hypothetical protein